MKGELKIVVEQLSVPAEAEKAGEDDLKWGILPILQLMSDHHGACGEVCQELCSVSTTGIRVCIPERRKTKAMPSFWVSAHRHDAEHTGPEALAPFKLRYDPTGTVAGLVPSCG